MNTTRIWLLSILGLTVAAVGWKALSIPPTETASAMTSEKVSASSALTSQVEKAKHEKVGEVVKTNAQWKKILTPVQYNILREKGTQRAFSGTYYSKEEGIYRCAACGLSLYSSATMFHSGTGWPSFYQPLAASHVTEITDPDGQRTEILCARCGGHLGHVFNDGPKPTGLRYCMNDAALKFEKAPVKTAAATANSEAKVQFVNAKKTEASKASILKTATFAGGCFWSMEAIFKQLKGVEKAVPGYSGGTAPKPTYELVETGQTGYAESLSITYDSRVIAYTDLLKVLLTVRNPTTLNRQGPDVGPQYRMILFYHDATQKTAIQKVIAKFTEDKLWSGKIIAEVQPFKKFYTAEEYHFDYYNQHPNQPYCAGVIAPEIKEFREKFHSMLKS